MTTASGGVTQLLDTASVLVCAGAGGVGKTTTSAAIALAAAERGRRVVVVTIDPAKRLADSIGVTLSHEPSRVPNVTGGELWAVMLDTRSTFDDLVRRYSASPEQAELILSNRFYRNLAGSLSGTQEYMAAEKLHELHNDERFDLVVVDTPPTRHALDFLDAPKRLTHFLDHRLYRVLVAPTRLGMRVASAAAQPFLKSLSRVVGGDALGEAITFFQAFDGMEAGFRSRADSVLHLLQSAETGYVLVTAPRREPVDEAVFFAGRLETQQLRVSAVVTNRVHPTFAGDLDLVAVDAALAATPDSPTHDLWQNLATLRRMVASEQEVLEPLLSRIQTAGPVELTSVPLLATDVHDLDSLRTVARYLVGLHPSGPLR
jgi:anion-transporting  ArsA/GET3 family ATPase